MVENKTIALVVAPNFRKQIAADAPKKRAVKLHTYAVSYSMIGGEIILYEFRIRTKSLTYAQLAGSAQLIGEVAERQNGKWSEFGRGALPRASHGTLRFIREVKGEL